MTKSITNPLAGIIAAAQKAPAKTGVTDTIRMRLNNATAAVFVLADVSGSMSEMAGSRRKCEILQEAVDAVLPAQPGTRLLAFASIPTEIPPGASLPAPSGGTALHLALEVAAKERPRHTVVISDGLPDSQELALSAAKRMTGIIDVIYCGRDDDAEAIAFMHRLARVGGGRADVHDVRRAGTPSLAAPLKARLALPGRRG